MFEIEQVIIKRVDPFAEVFLNPPRLRHAAPCGLVAPRHLVEHSFVVLRSLHSLFSVSEETHLATIDSWSCHRYRRMPMRTNQPKYAQLSTRGYARKLSFPTVPDATYVLGACALLDFYENHHLPHHYSPIMNPVKMGENYSGRDAVIRGPWGDLNCVTGTTVSGLPPIN